MTTLMAFVCLGLMPAAAGVGLMLAAGRRLAAVTRRLDGVVRTAQDLELVRRAINLNLRLAAAWIALVLALVVTLIGLGAAGWLSQQGFLAVTLTNSALILPTLVQRRVEAAFKGMRVES